MSVSILVVDDEPDVVDLFRQHFRRELRSGAYVLRFASSGRDALAQLFAGVEPELLVIVSDINIPEMDGLDLLREIKRHWSDIRVIMITANEGSRHRAYAEMLGVDDYIRKPFAMERLLESAEKLCPLGQAAKEGSERV